MSGRRSVLLLLTYLLGTSYGQTENNDTLAVLGQVPSIVSIWQVSPSTTAPGVNNTDFQCAGVLITSEHVITTITCVEQAKHGYGHVVSAGHVSRSDVTSLQFHDVIEVIRHEGYDNVTKAQDIAIMKVSPSFVIGPHIQPIKIRQTMLTFGAACTVAGWRLNFFYTSDNLRVNDVVHLNDEACTTASYRQGSHLGQSGDDKGRGQSGDDVDGRGHAGDAEGRDIVYGGIKMCAGLEDGSECNVGDEGGPLICDGALTGLYSSYGTMCLSTSPEPSLYHYLYYYWKWIEIHAPGVELSSGGAVKKNFLLMMVLLFVVGFVNS